ncbi:hypothetical protein LQR31_21940 [Chromobacterium vaccinii]|uniref:hypothetical protein n=1 Tax=Chromobacterium vaccinii TaxID=1108595 RepID=UPI001E6387DB|nr:hypothetical protein [Chromobacterium vaccinii]MCD4487135.1 hypothetical protein [Chromobacterium vaccinii]
MRKFRYRLAALMRFQESSLQPLRQALQEAENRLESDRAALRAAETEVVSCERALPSLVGNQALYLSALNFIRELRLRCRQLEHVVEDSEALRDRAMADLSEAQARLRQLEKHKDRQHESWRAEAQRGEYREQDDAWLQRRVAGGLA